MNITWKGSPNFDKNRTPIDRVVLHWFGAGTLESANTTFQKTGGTSAHYGISDDRVWQWVKEEDVAYHAGNYIMNQRSIGIEHDANPDKPASELTYKTSSQLLAEICKKYSIPLDRQHILQHKEIKATQCPGTLDIDKIINMAKTILSPSPAPTPSTIDLGGLQTPLETYGVMEINTLKSKLLAKDTDLKNKENQITDLTSKLYNADKQNSELVGKNIVWERKFIELRTVKNSKNWWFVKYAQIMSLIG